MRGLDSGNFHHRLFREMNQDIGSVSPYFIQEKPLRFSQQRGVRGNIIYFIGPDCDGKFRETVIKVGRDKFDDLGEYMKIGLIVIHVTEKVKAKEKGGGVPSQMVEETKDDDGSILSAISTEEGRSC